MEPSLKPFLTVKHSTSTLTLTKNFHSLLLLTLSLSLSLTNSFRREFGCLEAAGATYCHALFTARPLSTLVSLKRYMAINFCLVSRRTTSYQKRYALILLVTSHTIFRIADWCHRPTRVFSPCFVHTHTLFGKLFRRSPTPKLLQVKHALLWSSYDLCCRKKDASCWYM